MHLSKCSLSNTICSIIDRTVRFRICDCGLIMEMNDFQEKLSKTRVSFDGTSNIHRSFNSRMANIDVFNN